MGCTHITFQSPLLLKACTLFLHKKAADSQSSACTVPQWSSVYFTSPWGFTKQWARKLNVSASVSVLFPDPPFPQS